MKFTFEQTTDDILDLSKDSSKKNNIRKVIYVILAVVVLASILPEILGNGFNSSTAIAWLFSLGFMALIWVVFYRFLGKKMIFMMGDKKRMTGQRELEFTEEEIRLWTPDSATAFKWSAVSTLRESEHSYFLYLGRAQAIILPKRVFEDDIEENEFLDLVESCMG